MSPLDAPAAAFDALVLGGDLARTVGEAYDVVALPGCVPGDVGAGDLVIRRALGEGSIASVVPAIADPGVAPAAPLPGDRLVLRPKPLGDCGCGCGGGAPADAVEAAPVCVPAPETDAKGARPLIARPSRRPVVGHAQRCLNAWMAGHDTRAHACGDAAYVAESFRYLRGNGQLPLVEDCVFGRNTDRATRAFQACHRLQRDGAIGRLTWPPLETYAPGRGGVTVVDVDASYGLFAEFVVPVDGDVTRNLFRGADRRATRATEQRDAQMVSVRELEKAGAVAPRGTRPDEDFLVPLRALLVLPGAPPATGTPLALLVHGNFSAASPSYRGYEYLQRDLAARGIGSLSIDVNVMNGWPDSAKADNEGRAQVMALHVALVVALLTSTSPPSSPLRLKVGDRFVPLPDAVRDGRDPKVTRLRDLGERLRAARVDLARVGLFGHSRSARAVQVFCENVVAASRPAAAPPASPAAEDVVNGVTAAILRAVRQPVPSAVRAVVSFEHGIGEGLPLRGLPELFLLVVVGTHDEDTSMNGLDVYEAPVCAKALCVVHGATHSRFNTVWRPDPDHVRMIEAIERCQGRGVVLDAATHERFATVFVGDLFEARLRDVPARLRLYTGERREESLRTRVVRNWLFAHPVATPGGVVPLGDLTIRNPVSAAPVAARPVRRASYESAGNSHQQRAASFEVPRGNGVTAEVAARIGPEHGLPGRTHVSFRMSKDFDPKGPLKTTVRLRNFALLFRDASGATVGRTVPGSAVRSLLHRPLPVSRPNDDDRCEDMSDILIQTVEVPVATLVPGGTAGLARVTSFVVRLLPENGVPTPDVWRFADFALTTRTGV